MKPKTAAAKKAPAKVKAAKSAAKASTKSTTAKKAATKKAAPRPRQLLLRLLPRKRNKGVTTVITHPDGA